MQPLLWAKTTCGLSRRATLCSFPNSALSASADSSLELQNRLLANEAFGPRQIEKPTPRSGTPQGSRENGGFWYALNGPVVLGVATFDPAAARDLLRRMTFSNFAAHFPDYWTGRWSASDSLDSSLLPTTGLSTGIPWCAHAHAWPLYCYLRLNENSA